MDRRLRDRHVRAEAALYEAPFEYVREHVDQFDVGFDVLDTETLVVARGGQSGHAEGIRRPRRYIATPETAKHRLFVWLDPSILADHAVVVIARDDDYTFGILHHGCMSCGRAARDSASEVESGFRYTPTTTFETFPFPHPTEEQRERVGEAARRLVELRDGWLNPPGLDPADLEKRTLTNLYNQRPTWLDHAHAASTLRSSPPMDGQPNQLMRRFSSAYC